MMNSEKLAIALSLAKAVNEAWLSGTSAQLEISDLLDEVAWEKHRSIYALPPLETSQKRSTADNQKALAAWTKYARGETT